MIQQSSDVDGQLVVSLLADVSAFNAIWLADVLLVC